MNKFTKVAVAGAVGMAGVFAVVGITSNGGAPASNAPASVVTQLVKPAHGNTKAANAVQWATQATPILNEIAAQEAKLTDNPIDQGAGKALAVAARQGLHMSVTSGHADVDTHWKLTMQATQQVATDIKNYDMGAMVADLNTQSVDADFLTKAMESLS